MLCPPQMAKAGVTAVGDKPAGSMSITPKYKGSQRVLAVLSMAARTAQGPHGQWGATSLSCKDAAGSPQYSSKRKGGLILHQPEPGLFPARL